MPLARGARGEAKNTRCRRRRRRFSGICGVSGRFSYHCGYDRPPLSRRERAEQVRKRDVFAKYGDKARAVLEALVEKYADAGIDSIEDIKILTLDPFTRLGTAPELIGAFGGKPKYLAAVRELERALYG